MRFCVLASASGGLATVASAGPGCGFQFTEVTNVAGLGSHQFASSSRHSLGVVWFDANNDGHPDIFASNGYDLGFGQNLRPHLYLNDGDGTFTIADTHLPAFANLEYVGALAADYDRDGDTDLFVYTAHEDFDLRGVETNPYDGPANLLLKNMFVENKGVAGPGQFIDVAAAAGLDDCPPGLETQLGPGTTYGCYQTRSATFLDYDLDGWLDLYVAHMVMNRCASPDPIEDAIGKIANEDLIYRNNGDGTFTAQPGVIQAGDATRRGALVARSGHLNNDPWPDIYVGNVGANEIALDISDMNDVILINDGQGGFQPLPGFVGQDTPAAMGVGFADLNGDLKYDVYITDVRDHYANSVDQNAVGNTLYVTTATGLGANSAILRGVDDDLSWGVNFADFNLDGREELFVGSSRFFVPSRVYCKRDDGLLDATTLPTTNVRGSALADYDGDGDQDLLVVNEGFGLQLFRNDSPAPAANSLTLRFAPSQTNPDAIGVRVVVLTSEGRLLTRQVIGGSSAHSQDENSVVFGLGDATAEAAFVYWPVAEGKVQTLVSPGSGTFVVTEP